MANYNGTSSVNSQSGQFIFTQPGQQDQTERISGDGEERYYNYSTLPPSSQPSSVLQPGPLGVQPSMFPDDQTLSSLPPTSSSNSDAFDFAPNSHLSVFTPVSSHIEAGTDRKGPLTENRSVDGEEQNVGGAAGYSMQLQGSDTLVIDNQSNLAENRNADGQEQLFDYTVTQGPIYTSQTHSSELPNDPQGNLTESRNADGQEQVFDFVTSAQGSGFVSQSLPPDLPLDKQGPMASNRSVDGQEQLLDSMGNLKIKKGEGDNITDESDRGSHIRRREGWHREKKKKHRHRDRDRERSRNDDWDSVSTRESYRHDRTYDDDYYHRPRSRTSSYIPPSDDSYDRRHHRRDHRDHDSRHWEDDYRGYPKNQRPPWGYMEPSMSMYATLPRTSYGAGPGYNPYPPAPAVQTPTPTQVYLDRFRIQNPKEYRIWYEKYLAHLRHPGVPCPPLPGFSSKNLPSVQEKPVENQRPTSGRSSVADELAGIIGNDGNMIKDEPKTPPRTTPCKFSTLHVPSVFSPVGPLLTVRGHTVTVTQLSKLAKSAPEYRELVGFPGPLASNSTHKSTVIRFCQRKIEAVYKDHREDPDCENLILIWELLILLLRQNGKIVGSDIAELLLGSTKSSDQRAGKQSIKSSQSESEDEGDVQFAHTSNSKRFLSKNSSPQAVEVFCKKFLFGRQTEALDYAMDENLWGHALFFASQIGGKTYGSVLAKFANTMGINSPLQTLYQILSGKIPASVSYWSWDAFGDWRPHLAMIISNAGQRPEIEAKAISIMGDTLGSEITVVIFAGTGTRGYKFAAQFCYLVANMEFSEDSKLGPLLGFDPKRNNVLEATQMTEIYEFAMRMGNEAYSAGMSFIGSKLDYALTLINVGFSEKAYNYCEDMAKSLCGVTLNETEKLVAYKILSIAERLVFVDPTVGSENPKWIEDLRSAAFQTGSDSRKSSAAQSISDNMDETSKSTFEPTVAPAVITQDSNIQKDPLSSQIPFSSNNDIIGNAQPAYSWNLPQAPIADVFKSAPVPFPVVQDSVNVVKNIQSLPPTSSNTQSFVQPAATGFETNNNNYLSRGPFTEKHEEHANPNSMIKPDKLRPEPPNRNKLENSESAKKHKGSKDQQNSKKEQKGWLSGMISALSFKPKNQMILPEDKAPAIVWDPAAKKWVNTKEDEEEDSAPVGPPPKDSDLLNGNNTMGIPAANNGYQPSPGNHAQLPANNPPTPAPAVSSATSQIPSTMLNGGPSNLLPSGGANKYKRPKGISPRNNYVDIFKSNAESTQASQPSVPLPMPTGGPAGVPNIFMPNPVANDGETGSRPTSFLTPSSENGDSAEVQPPPMFNPAQFQNQPPFPVNQN